MDLISKNAEPNAIPGVDPKLVRQERQNLVPQVWSLRPNPSLPLCSRSRSGGAPCQKCRQGQASNASRYVLMQLLHSNPSVYADSESDWHWSPRKVNPRAMPFMFPWYSRLSPVKPTLYREL